MHVCFYHVRFSSSVLSQEVAWNECTCNELFCHNTLTQSVKALLVLIVWHGQEYCSYLVIIIGDYCWWCLLNVFICVVALLVWLDLPYIICGIAFSHELLDICMFVMVCMMVGARL